METCTTAADDEFTLNYCEVTTVSLFRHGFAEESIPHHLRCLSRAEWKATQQTFQKKPNSEGRRKNVRTTDFILDDNDGKILTEISSGNNEL